MTESSETTVHRDSLRERNPRLAGVLQLLTGTSCVQPPETVQRTLKIRGLLQIQKESVMPDL
jgi:hypothetical protein